jgi:hypothetical protein
MVLTRDELLSSLQSEVRILLHLISKVEQDKLDYRPNKKQRSTIELLRYLAIVCPIHFRGVMADHWDRDTWAKTWSNEEAAVKTLSLDQLRDAIAKHADLYAEGLNACPEERLRAPVEMFGYKGVRGPFLVNLVLNHYAAYRMQLFLYLKGSGREELSTMNLWVGTDNRPGA